jgi:hypothetical protein
MIEFRTKKIVVCGVDVTVYSVDAVRWFSNKADCLRCEKARATFWRKSRRSVKRSAIFAHETRAVGRMD